MNAFMQLGSQSFTTLWCVSLASCYYYCCYSCIAIVVSACKELIEDREKKEKEKKKCAFELGT